MLVMTRVSQREKVASKNDWEKRRAGVQMCVEQTGARPESNESEKEGGRERERRRETEKRWMGGWMKKKR